MFNAAKAATIPVIATFGLMTADSHFSAWTFAAIMAADAGLAVINAIQRDRAEAAQTQAHIRDQRVTTYKPVAVQNAGGPMKSQKLPDNNAAFTLAQVTTTTGDALSRTTDDNTAQSLAERDGLIRMYLRGLQDWADNAG